MSRLSDLAEDAESGESDVEAVGSPVGESLLRYTIMTPQKIARKLAEWEPMSKFHGS